MNISCFHEAAYGELYLLVTEFFDDQMKQLIFENY